jgi:hypothetical protein
VRLREVRDILEEDVPNPTNEVQQGESMMVTDEHVEPQPLRSIHDCHTTIRYNLLTTGQHELLFLDNEDPNTYMKAMTGT